ncbi:uncharacterized protein LOC122525678 [Polistes fuscatus]|uniref:uncharacterized protein LOC122525678 n=1 Tax=Polistes fuscatus TaxID=30207 RepID=UPI001CA8BBC7|nr:uncharacterized protein LOC122525678 [Polistes fuscatus]
MLNNAGEMTANLNRDELRIIFEFLNGIDLYNASQVCRLWSEIAKEESKRRGSSCLMKQQSSPCLDSWESWKTQFIDCCQVKPSLHMFYCGIEYEKKLPEGCYCESLPPNCISILLKHFFLWCTKTSISSIFFPEISNLQTSTITFNKHPWHKGIYCEELKCLFDNSLSNADQLKTVFEPIINDDFPTSGCIIFIYDIATSCLSKLALSLQNWFPNGKTSILGLGLDELSICNSNYNSHVCQHSVDCVAILLNGTDMQSWILILENYSHDEERMKEFKEKINLKKHTIGFGIHGDNSNYSFECSEEDLFHKYFPNVPILQLYGNEAMATNELKGLYDNFSDRYDMMKTTAYMLLTYN